MPAIPIIVAAVSVIGAGVGAYSAIDSGQKQKEAADANADIANQNAIAAQQKAKYDEDLHRERVQKILKTQRALYGGSGVDMEGSPLMVQADTESQGELDALAIRRGGDVAASQQRSMANLYRMQGNNAVSSSYLQAGSSLLSGASSTLRGYYGKGKW